jgi:hypothetical protein
MRLRLEVMRVKKYRLRRILVWSMCLLWLGCGGDDVVGQHGAEEEPCGLEAHGECWDLVDEHIPGDFPERWASVSGLPVMPLLIVASEDADIYIDTYTTWRDMPEIAQLRASASREYLWTPGEGDDGELASVLVLLPGAEMESGLISFWVYEIR